MRARTTQPLSSLSKLATDAGKPHVVNARDLPRTEKEAPTFLSHMSKRMGYPVFYEEDGVQVTNSYLVAEFFQKRHDQVIVAIRNWVRRLRHDPDLLFEERRVVNDAANGRQDKYYKMTEDAVSLVAMSFTGDRAAAFKISYIREFRRVSRELQAETE